MYKFIKLILKFFGLAILVLSICSELNAQPTYVQRISFNVNQGYLHPEDSILKLLNFSASPAGFTFIHMNNERGSGHIYKLDLNGNIIWEAPGTHHSTFSTFTMPDLKATNDGGCAYLINQYASGGGNNWWSFLYKLDSLGNVEWWVEVPPQLFSGSQVQETFDIGILPDGYACLARDSIFIFDLNGTKKGTLNFSGPGKLQGFNNGDLFYNSPSLKARIDSSGNILYSLSDPVLNFDTTFYKLVADTLHLIDAMSGMTISKVYFSSSSLNPALILSDGGWIKYSSSQLYRYSSQGVLIWTNTISLAHFGIDLIGEQVDGTILTGGVYLSFLEGRSTFDYSAFIGTIDSSGQSIMDSTSQVWISDANDDGIGEFGDAIYAALAYGSTGPARYDPADASFFESAIGDIATDFPISFVMGVNHKQCDKFPDGIIDSIDIKKIADKYTTSRTITLWKSSSPDHLLPANNSESVLPYFSCLPERDSAMTGDTVRFHFILGDNGIQIDSLFGLAFIVMFDSNYTGDVGKRIITEAMSSELGSLTDLRIYATEYFTGAYNANEVGLVIGRKDLQNAYFVQDTIGYVDIQILDSMGGNIDLTMSLRSFKAITAGGFPIDFQFNTRPVHLRSFITKVSELKEDKIKLYPNPVKDKLILDGLQNAEFEISIYNYEGKECYSGFNNKFSRLTIDTKEFNSGFYIITFRDETGQVSSRKFIKE